MPLDRLPVPVWLVLPAWTLGVASAMAALLLIFIVARGARRRPWPLGLVAFVALALLGMGLHLGDAWWSWSIPAFAAMTLAALVASVEVLVRPELRRHRVLAVAAWASLCAAYAYLAAVHNAYS